MPRGQVPQGRLVECSEEHVAQRRDHLEHRCYCLWDKICRSMALMTVRKQLNSIASSVEVRHAENFPEDSLSDSV